MFISGPIVILDSEGRGDPIVVRMDVTEPTTSVSPDTTSTYLNTHILAYLKVIWAIS